MRQLLSQTWDHRLWLPSWNEIGRKLIAMAEDFPEDKHDFKPTPAQRGLPNSCW